jgi:hypothetical protein
MFKIQRKFVESCLLIMLLFLLASISATAKEPTKLPDVVMTSPAKANEWAEWA